MYSKIKKNNSTYVVFPLVDADGDLVSGATITGEYNYWEDGTDVQAAFIALTNAETEIGSTGVYRVQLTAGETNHGYIVLKFTSGTSKPILMEFRTMTNDPEYIATTASGALVWASGTRALTDKAGFTISGTTQTFDALDTLLDSAHGAGSWASAVGFSTHSAADVWTAGSRALTTPNDYKATGFSTHAAADIWSVVTRQLTGTISDFDELDTALDSAHGAGSWLSATGFSTHAAADIWSVGSRTITGGTVATATDVTNDVGITQAGADKVWGTTTRNLSGTINDFDELDTALDSAHGAGSWLTGGAGGATIQVIPSIPKNIDVSGTKTVRIALYVIDQNDDLPTTGEIIPGTLSIDRSADGGTTWSNIFTDQACSEHAGCIYFDEVFDSGTGYASGDMVRFTFKGQKCTISANDHEIADGTNGMIFTTRMDSGLSGGGPSAGDIADAVWDEPIVDHTTSSQFGGKNQKVVPSETIADYKATGFSTHAAADIWSVGTRELSGTISDFDALDTALDSAHGAGSWASAVGFSTHSAADVWTTGSRELSTPSNYMADVQTTLENNDLDHLIQVTAGVEEPTAGSYLDQLMHKDGSQTFDRTHDSLEAMGEHMDDIVQDTGTDIPNSLTTIQADLDSPSQYQADVSGLATSAALSTHDGKLDTVDANVDKIAGVVMAHCVLEFTTYDVNDNMTDGKMYVYDTKANATTNNHSTGLLWEFTMDATFDGSDRPTLRRWVEEP